MNVCLCINAEKEKLLNLHEHVRFKCKREYMLGVNKIITMHYATDVSKIARTWRVILLIVKLCFSQQTIEVIAKHSSTRFIDWMLSKLLFPNLYLYMYVYVHVYMYVYVPEHVYVWFIGMLIKWIPSNLYNAHIFVIFTKLYHIISV